MTKQEIVIRDHKLGSLMKRVRDMEDNRGWACQGPYRKELQEKSGIVIYAIGLEREWEE